MSESLIAALCAAMIDHDASDLFVTEGGIPKVRRHGEILTWGEAPLTLDDLTVFRHLCKISLEARDADSSYTHPNGSRFRVSFFQHLGKSAATVRRVATTVPSIETLGLPHELLKEWVSRKAGLILITGPTNTGKSTTIASLMEWVNQNFSKHILTIEDPIEFLFVGQHSLFTQREVGLDTESFARGLKQALRQSPDIIMVGEIRDRETAQIALQAAETGHLVIATLHSGTCPESLERLIRLFPADERDGISMILSSQLIGIQCQRLLPTIDGNMIATVEHLHNQGLSRRYILESRWKELTDFIQKSDSPKNCSMLNWLIRLCKQGKITEESALAIIQNPQDLQRALKGIA
ncbi:MAG: PilT/PilU family type 4a pilus ATPase [Verrucomicrobiota bacterium]